jgi:protein SCO1/2
MFKTRPALISYLLLAAIAAAALLWHKSANLPKPGGGAQLALGGPYLLTDQDGHPRSSSDFRGQYQLIYFGYSSCPDLCPTTLAVMAAALEQLGPSNKRIVPVFITIDPERDQPEVLKSYLAAFGPRFVGLTGTPQQIEGVERQFRVYARKQPSPNGGYSMDHSSVLFLMGPDNKLLSLYDEAASPEALAKDIARRL